MNENTWAECLETNSSMTVTPDGAKARSLIETAKGRADFLKETPITERNINYIFEGYYSSALELLHALLSKRGHKVTNHLCVGFYLRDVLKDDELFRIFDDCRYKRNSLVYYGRKMDHNTAKDAIGKTKTLIEQLSEHLAKGGQI